MTTETKPTPDHIKFAPLILPRKTPAEELREIVRIVGPNRTQEIREELEALAARLETPDEPKRWDGVFPWVGRYDANDYPIVHFSNSLRVHGHPNELMCFAYAVGRESVDHVKNQSPYHDGVIITITAGSGDEDVKVMRGNLSHALYLSLGEWCVRIRGVCVGELAQCRDKKLSPLPPGTVTRIVINNTLPTTEQRYSVEVVEPPKPKYTPCPKHLGFVEGVAINQDDASNLDDIEGPTFCVDDWQFSIEGTSQLIEVAQSWLNEHGPPQEQPATEAVAEGLPLEIACDCDSDETMTLLPPDRFNRLAFYFDSGSVYLSPADEARLRNLLNQRAKGGDE